MQHPELMHIIIAQYHRDLREYSKPGPPISPFAEARRAARIDLGRALVRLGELLGGQSRQELAPGTPA